MPIWTYPSTTWEYDPPAPNQDHFATWAYGEALSPIVAALAPIAGNLSGAIVASTQLGQAPSITATSIVIEGDLSGELVAAAALGEVPSTTAFPTVVDAQVTVGQAAKWYSIIGSENIGSSEGDLEIAPDFSVDRIWWTGSDFRLNRNPLGEGQAGADNDFDEYFQTGGTGQLAHVYLVTDVGVAEIAVTSRRSIGPHYLNLTPNAASQNIIESVSVGDVVRLVIGPAGLSFVDAITATPVVIDGDLSGAIVASTQLGQAPSITATSVVIDGDLSGEIIASAALGEVPSTTAFPTVVDAQVTVGEAAKWYSIIDPENIGSFEGDLEITSDFSIDRIWWTGSDFRFNRNPLGERQDGDDNDFDEYFQTGGTGQDAYFYLVTDSGVAEIAVTSRRSIGPHYLNLTPDVASQNIIEAVSVGDTVRLVIGPAGLSFVTVQALTITLAPIEGDLSGDIVASAALGSATKITATLVPIDGDLSGNIVASLNLGQAPPILPLKITPVIINGVLSGNIVASAALGSAVPITGRLSISRTILFSGTHEIDVGASYVYDGRKNYNLIDIDLNKDILYNVTDGCSGIITSISDNGRRLNIDMLSGGIQNVFNVGDAYQILDGSNLEDIARRFELFLDANEPVLIQLHVTDRNGNMSSDSILVQCD